MLDVARALEALLKRNEGHIMMSTPLWAELEGLLQEVTEQVDLEEAQENQ